jgi:2-dehydro-3-deoxygalactonokinase
MTAGAEATIELDSASSTAPGFPNDFSSPDPGQARHRPMQIEPESASRSAPRSVPQSGPEFAPILGIDWGTTNRRAYLLGRSGELLRRHDDDQGILAVKGDYEASLAALLKQLELSSANVILSGMVGSRNGWREAPYLTVEQPIDRLAESMMPIEVALPGVQCRVVPGYRYTDRHGMPDVMRGEETQVLGALTLAATDGWFLLPGTHSKWVLVREGSIVEFATFMTGELFALFSGHGTLSAMLREQQQVPAAFEQGMVAAGLGAFTHLAFCCRAQVVTDSMPAAHAASWLSGLLIGTELRDIRRRVGLHGDDGLAAPLSARPSVQVIGSAALEDHYVQALHRYGMAPRVWQADEVYLAALRRLAGLAAPSDAMSPP